MYRVISRYVARLPKAVKERARLSGMARTY